MMSRVGGFLFCVDGMDGGSGERRGAGGGVRKCFAAGGRRMRKCFWRVVSPKTNQIASSSHRKRIASSLLPGFAPIVITNNIVTMTKSNTRTNKSIAKASGKIVKDEKRVESTLEVLAKRPNLNEYTSAALVSLPATSKAAIRINKLKNPSNVQLTKIVNHYHGMTKIAAKSAAMQAEQTNFSGRLLSGLKCGKFAFDAQEKTLSITGGNYDTFMRIRNMVDGTNYTRDTHNTAMRNAGFQRVYSDGDGNDVDKDVYVWRHKDNLFDPSDPSKTAKAITINSRERDLKGKGHNTNWTLEEVKKLAEFMKANPQEPMWRLTDDKAAQIVPGRNANAVLGSMKSKFGSRSIKNAMNHPNFPRALALQKTEAMVATKPTGEMEDSKLPAVPTKAKNKRTKIVSMDDDRNPEKKKKKPEAKNEVEPKKPEKKKSRKVKTKKIRKPKKFVASGKENAKLDHLPNNFSEEEWNPSEESSDDDDREPLAKKKSASTKHHMHHRNDSDSDFELE